MTGNGRGIGDHEKHPSTDGAAHAGTSDPGNRSERSSEKASADTKAPADPKRSTRKRGPDPERKQELKRSAAIFAVIISIMLILVLFFSEDRPSQGSAYSDDWNDISSFRTDIERAGYDTECIMSNSNIITRVDDPEQTLFIASGIERGYSVQEANNIVDFVEDGGRLLVMDDFANGNSIGNYFGVEFSGLRMWQRNFQHNASFSRVSLTLADVSYNVTMNAPTTLEENKEKVKTTFQLNDHLLRSSKESWVDSNENGIVDADDDRGPFDLGFELIISQNVTDTTKLGRAVFISDPDFISNELWDLTDNRNFSMALVEYLLPGGGTVIFDESRHLHETTIERGFQSFLRFFVSFSVASHFIVRLLVIAIVVNIAAFSIYFTPVPTFRKHRFNVTYELPPPEQPSLTELRRRLRKILVSRVKNRYHLFVDIETMTAYDLNNHTYDLRDRDHLMHLIDDEVLVKFLLSPGKNFSENQLSEIALHVQRWNSD